MDTKQQKKIDSLIKYLKREPREVDMAPKRKGYLSFDTKDNYKKYRMLDKHIKLVAKCIDEGYITSDKLFSSFNRMEVRNYDGKLELYVLFPNVAKMVLSPSSINRILGWHFLNKFDFLNTYGQEINIDNLRLEEPRDRSNFDLVCN